MDLQNVSEQKMAALRLKIKAASFDVKKAEESVKRAENKHDKALDAYNELFYEYECLLIESWKGQPDWNILLDNPDNHSAIMYDLFSHYIQEMRLSYLGVNIHTNQRAIGIYFETNSPSEMNEKIKGIKFIAPYIKEYKGKKYFNISNLRDENCAYELWITNEKLSLKDNLSSYAVVRMTYGSIDKIHPFSTLESALSFVQSELSNVDLVQENDYLESK
jgi:hypothetical protein